MFKNISVVASFTADPLQESFQKISSMLGLGYRLQLAPYGQLFQELLDSGSLFNSGDSSFNVALLKIGDFPSRDYASDDLNCSLADDIVQSLEAYAGLSSTPLLFIVTPDNSANSSRETQRFIQQLNDGYTLPSIVRVVGFDQLANSYELSELFDAAADRLGHVPYTDNFYATLALYICRFIHGYFSPEKKVIVLDCDNTLWQGVCGEDGPTGVTITAGHRFMQEFMLAKKNAGTLLCICSKNNEEDVLKVFSLNQEMLLGIDDFLLTKISWDSKSKGIHEISQELDLGLDSFIFVDDNPVELAEIESTCPGVVTIEVPADQSNIAARLTRHWAFDKFRTTKDDALRARSYKDNLKRNQLQQQTTSFKDFIQKLDLNLNISRITGADRERVIQLSQRTNQFNCTSKRRSDNELDGLDNGDITFVYKATLKDRFGDYGTVGILALQLEGELLRVTDFLLSCRVLGKGVEHQILTYAAEFAVERRLNSVEVAFNESPRNEPAKRFLESVQIEVGGSKSGSAFVFAADSLATLKFNAPVAAPVEVTVDKKTNSSLDSTESENEFFRRAAALCQPEEIVARLLAEVSSRPDIQQSYVVPEGQIEKKLAQIWQQVLQLESVGRLDRFSDLGGSSLKLITVHKHIEKEFGIAVSLVELLERSTVKELAALLSNDEDLNQSGNIASMRISAARVRAQKQRAVHSSFRRRYQGGHD